ncbi:MAG TPA: hypothetical protein VF234_08480, partial [Limnochordia bacterium]
MTTSSFSDSDSGRMVVASAPAKVILFGEHAINRGQPALVAGVGLRTRCTARLQGAGYILRSGAEEAHYGSDELLALKASIDRMRRAKDHEAIREQARSGFFTPVAYALAHLLAEAPIPPLAISWETEIPLGSGLGSGAAASAAMILAASRAAGLDLPPAERARLAWQGDVVAHGGVASGLDSGGCTYGGVVSYSVAGGWTPLTPPVPLTIVIADTGVRARTADVNASVARWLAADPARMEAFEAIGRVSAAGTEALAAGDLVRLGALMNEN